MQMQYREKTNTCCASMTLYMSLMLIVVLSLLLTLIESARVYEVQNKMTLISNVATESGFAEYQPYLWENYHLLFLDAGDNGKVSTEKLENKMALYALANLKEPGKTYYEMFPARLGDCKMTDYELATDREGKAMLQQISSLMGSEVTKAVAETILNRITAMDKVEKENKDTDKKLESAKKDLETARSAAKTEAEEQGTEIDLPDEKDNPIEIVSEMKKSTILNLVLENAEQVSNQAIAVEQGLMNRNCEQGTYKGTSEYSWYEKILVQQYCTKYFTSYQDTKKAGELQYEQEYILCGNASDKENLESIVKKMIAIREAGNICALLKDTQKLQAAQTVATSFAGFTMNPAIITAVQIGILAAWAFVESILDVRTILAGGKISLVKNAGEWTSDLDNFSKWTGKLVKAKECSAGDSYQDYLNRLFYFAGVKSVSYHMMDIFEGHLRMSGAKNAKMDHMLQRATVTYSYEAKPVFLSMIPMEISSVGNYTIVENTKFDYVSWK